MRSCPAGCGVTAKRSKESDVVSVKWHRVLAIANGIAPSMSPKLRDPRAFVRSAPARIPGVNLSTEPAAPHVSSWGAGGHGQGRVNSEKHRDAIWDVRSRGDPNMAVMMIGPTWNTVAMNVSETCKRADKSVALMILAARRCNRTPAEGEAPCVCHCLRSPKLPESNARCLEPDVKQTQLFRSMRADLGLALTATEPTFESGSGMLPKQLAILRQVTGISCLLALVGRRSPSTTC